MSAVFPAVDNAPGMGVSSHILRTLEAALPLMFIVVISLLLRSGIASIPLDRDEGAYAYIAQRWLAGEVPYRDIFDHKPPGIYLAYAALFASGLTSGEAIHWLSHSFVLGTAVVLYVLGSRVFGGVVGWCAALVLLVLAMDGSVAGNSANTEAFAILPLTAAVALSFPPTKRHPLATSFLAGLCSGIAGLFRPVVLPVVALVFVWIGMTTVGSRRAKSDPWRLCRVLAFALGIELTLAPFVYYFWPRAGHAVIDALYHYNRAYGGVIPLSAYLPALAANLRLIFLAQLPICLAALSTLMAAVWQTGHRRRLLWWWITSLAAVSLTGRFYPHGFVLLMPSTALLAAVMVERVGRVFGRWWLAWPQGVAVLLALGTAAWPVAIHREWYWTGSPDRASRIIYAPNAFPEAAVLGRLLRDHTSPDDTIFIFGSEAEILFHAERQSASRYIYIYPLYISHADPREEQRQQEVAHELRRQPPKFIVGALLSTSFAPDLNRPMVLESALNMMLRDAYEPFLAVQIDRNGNSRWERPARSRRGEKIFRVRADLTPVFEVYARRSPH